jgi:hypothetical protein
MGGFGRISTAVVRATSSKPGHLVRRRRRKSGSQRRSRTMLFVVLLCVVLLVPATTSGGAEPRIRPPVHTADQPDPELARGSDSTWRLYGTNTFNGGTLNVPVRTSANLISWSAAGEALPRVGSWANGGFTWAPGVIDTAADQWVLFYTANHRSSGRQCIGRAVSTGPSGPFVDRWNSPLVCQVSIGGSIDPSPFRANDGQLWLHWKSDENAIGRPSRLWAQRLTADGTALSGAPTAILAHDAAWEKPLIEQPEMVYREGRYWLFYSGGWWESSSYAVGYALCSGPAGPCSKRTRSAPWLSSASGAVGPGALSVAGLDDIPFATFHAWIRAIGYARGGVRAPFLEPIVFRTDGVILRPDLPRGAPTSTLPSGLSVAAGDFDGDSFDDLVGHDPGDGINDTLYWGSADRSHRAAPVTVAGTYRTPLSGDFDGDGREDILWYAPGTTPNSIWWGNTDRTFSGTRTPAVNGTYTATSGDFDGNGTHDILWYAPGTTPDSIWWGNTDRTFSGTRTPAVNAPTPPRAATSTATAPTTSCGTPIPSASLNRSGGPHLRPSSPTAE